MKLKDIDNFVILLNDAENNLIDIISKISLRKQAQFNWINIDGYTTAVLYNVDKSYLYNFGANKKLCFIWRDRDDFYIIDFRNSTKREIISYLTFENNFGEKIEGYIKYINLKSEYDNVKKVPLISSKQLDDNKPYSYGHFIIYKIIPLRSIKIKSKQ